MQNYIHKQLDREPAIEKVTKAPATVPDDQYQDRYVKLADLKERRSRPAPSTLEKHYRKGESGKTVVMLDGRLTVDLLELDLWMQSRFKKALQLASKNEVIRPRGRLKRVSR